MEVILLHKDADNDHYLIDEEFNGQEWAILAVPLFMSMGSIGKEEFMSIALPILTKQGWNKSRFQAFCDILIAMFDQNNVNRVAMVSKQVVSIATAMSTKDENDYIVVKYHTNNNEVTN